MVLMHCQENNSLLCSNHVKSKADNRKSITVVPQLMSARRAVRQFRADYDTDCGYWPATICILSHCTI
ncbi:hypothetical protein J6590_078564 [Homalodisca vitripennis]|nr:hypothetical protein J6590_078564 [Homalodisca vitripennis]